MKFNNPVLLYSFLVLLIPIAIHLFNFKRFKKIYFSNIALLKSVKLQSEKKSKLKHLLVLLSRIFAFTCLIIAFVQPIVPNTSSEDSKIKSIYIDNSFSMNSKNELGQLFEQSKELGINLIKTYGSNYSYKILTNDFAGIHNSTFTKDEAIDAIKNISISPANKTLNQIVERLDTEKSNEIFVFSDFQTSTIKLDEFASLKNIVLAPLTSQNTNNVFLDSVWLNSPIHNSNTNEIINIRIQNLCDENKTLKVSLDINDKMVSFSEIEIQEGDSEIIELSYNSNNKKFIKGEISLSSYDENDIVFDDTFYFSYTNNPKTIVSVISEDSNIDAYSNLFSLDSNTIIYNQKYSNIDYSKLDASNLIILNEPNKLSDGFVTQIKQKVEEGKSLILIPNKSKDQPSLNQVCRVLDIDVYGKFIENKVKIAELNRELPFMKGIFKATNKKMNLPVFDNYFSTSNLSKSKEKTLIRFNNNQPFLSQSTLEKGTVYRFHSTLNSLTHNFYSHALFVPILLRIKELSINEKNIEFKIGESFEIPNIYNSEDVFEISNSNTNFIPQTITQNSSLLINCNNNITSSGHYYIKLKNNQQQEADVISFNYNRLESLTNVLKPSEIEGYINEKGMSNIKLLSSNNIISSIQSHIQNNKGKSLWIYFIFAAILFFLLEILLIRFLK